MLNKTQLINHWKRWMNRNRTFSKSEMEELENHLWEEMDEMVATDGCSEEEAFAKVVVQIGSENRISQDFIKAKPSLNRVVYSIKNNSLFIIASLLLLIIFLFFDMMFAQTHSFQDYVSISEKQFIRLDKTYTEFSEYYPDKPFLINKLPSLLSIYQFMWFSTSPFYLETLPEYAGINPFQQLTFVIDDMHQLWIEQGFSFNQNSLKVKSLKPRKVRKINYLSYVPLPLPPIGKVNFIMSSGEKRQLSKVEVNEKDKASNLFSFTDESGRFFVHIRSIDYSYGLDNLNNNHDKNQLSIKDTTLSSIVLALQSFKDELLVKTEYIRVELVQGKNRFGDIETNEYALSTEYVDVVQKPQHIITYFLKKLFSK